MMSISRHYDNPYPNGYGQFMVDKAKLRPVERVILGMRDQGMPVTEIADRMRRSPDHIERVLSWVEIPRSNATRRPHPTPIQRRVLHLRSVGEDHVTIGNRFNKSARFIRQVEALAHYGEGLRLLSPE
jgi:hypothetical protein